MRRDEVVDVDRDAGVVCAAVGEGAHPRTEAMRGDTPRGEDTRGTAADRKTSRAQVRTAAGEQGTGRTQEAGM